MAPFFFTRLSGSYVIDIVVVTYIKLVVPCHYCRTSLKAAAVLLPLVGMTWVFGLLAVNNDTIAFAWIFTILNSLQVASYILILLVIN